jgi:hypothetical protein
MGEVPRCLPDHGRQEPERQHGKGGEARVAPEPARREIGAPVDGEETGVLEEGKAEDPDAEGLEHAVLEPRVERRVVPVAEGERLGEKELLGLVVLDRARREEPDTDMEDGVPGENGREPHARAACVSGPLDADLAPDEPRKSDDAATGLLPAGVLVRAW